MNSPSRESRPDVRFVLVWLSLVVGLILAFAWTDWHTSSTGLVVFIAVLAVLTAGVIGLLVRRSR